ncbi:methionine--tRNA ligase [Trifolium repens]|nr:methionine--tRNA ligase [Trifolium repens]
MAVRMNCCSLQNKLCFLNPSILSLRSTLSHIKSKPNFQFSPNPSRRALFCNCATSTPSNDEPFVLTTPLYYGLRLLHYRRRCHCSFSDWRKKKTVLKT